MEGDSADTTASNQRTVYNKKCLPETRTRDSSPPTSGTLDDSSLFGWIPPDYLKPYLIYIKGVIGFMVAFFVVAPGRFVTWMWNLLWTTVGVTLGIGLGAGLALHIFHQLQAWQKAHDDDKRKKEEQMAMTDGNRSSSLRHIQKSLVREPASTASSLSYMNQNGSTSFLEDGNSYLSLMAQAGYSIPDRVLRGQVLRVDHDFWDTVYKFTDEKIPQQQAVQLMADKFPTLPEPVTREIGRFIEHVMRDYISGWYCRLDQGVIYRSEEEKRKEGIPRDGGDVSSIGAGAASVKAEDGNQNDASGDHANPSRRSSNRRQSSLRIGSSKQESSATPQYIFKESSVHAPDAKITPSKPEDLSTHVTPTIHARKMVFSTMTHRRAPMIDCAYHVISTAFGNLATRAEHVNVLELVLLKWTQVLGHTFKTYRMLRKAAQEKNTSHGITDRPPTEVEITREYLMAGKLHRAVVFGLDVPSLLFADAAGDECGCGTDVPPKNPTQVLEQRLYHTNIVRECELDYNRVVASRLIRALLPKNEVNSNCVMALVIEIFAGCVFQPLMNLWIPSFLNDVIVRAMTKTKMTDGDESDEKSGDFQPEDEFAAAENDHIAETVEELAGPSVDLINNVSHVSALTDAVADSAGLPTDVSMRTDGLLQGDAENIVSEIYDSTFAGEADDDNLFTDEDTATTSDKLLTLSAMALAELAKFMDFDECREARMNNQEIGVNWDDPDSQTAVLKLVMVIEAAILDGRCSYRRCLPSDNEDMVEEVKQSVDSKSTPPALMIDDSTHTITHLLMEMTSDIAAFEKLLDQFEASLSMSLVLQEQTSNEFDPDMNEISTLRTLISTWLHTGQIYAALALVCRAADTIFAPFYSDDAFLRKKADREKLVRGMRSLDQVDVLVETMVVLSSPLLDVSEEYKLMTAANIPASRDPSRNNSPQKQMNQIGGDSGHVSDGLLQDPSNFGHSTPRFLDFGRNAAFASSLRAERERRLRAWETRQADESVLTVIRKTAVKKIDFDLHSELHNLARLFYNGTNIMSIRDARRNEDEPTQNNGGNEKVSLLTVETASNRRRIEVPDEDSSFLLRAQSRPLNPVSVHRDDRNHDMSYKCFLATYEEPAIVPGSTRYNGGKFVRRCLLQYYPSDRTASVVLQSDARKLDRRKGKAMVKDQNATEQNTTPYISGSFLRQRHLCQKFSQKGGVGSQGFLSSSLMESSDFNSLPRTGKALDFVYRMSLFERPTVDLAGKRFSVQDSSGRGVHRADASSLEISDASLSHMLLHIGKDWGHNRAADENETRHKVEMGPDGYPMIFFRITTKNGDHVNTEIKPYRMSFIRAALMVTSSRQEAQQQSLIDCVKAGSAKSATKVRTEEQLRPTVKLLQFANDTSKDQTKASCLNRDLKLGIYHVDKQQLRRNGLLNLRHPTTMLKLNAEVVGTAPAKEIPLAKLVNSKLLPDETLYKIRCTAIVELVDSEDSAFELEPYALDDGSLAALYREEWVVYRSMKDFQVLHKELKMQVNATESSMSTGTRIVGAATAALSIRSAGRRNKKILIPSLAQAGKIGSMGVTKRSIAKRMELLDEYLGYLLSSNSLMSRSSELLLFLGASHPFPPEVTVTKAPANLMDPLGRMEFVRSVALKESGDVINLKRKFSPSKPRKAKPLPRAQSKINDEDDVDLPRNTELTSEYIMDMDPGIASKVDQIVLAEVRNHIFDLMRCLFGFENASFVRSQVLAALETASFVAVAKQSDFRRLLYNLHSKQLNGDALGGWIRMLLDLLWPDGVWGKPKPLLSAEEELALRDESRVKLHEGFPDNIRKMLGKELTKEGLDMIHDMLQNKLVVKSMFYMLFDLVWIEILPELRDSLPCASALDLDLL